MASAEYRNFCLLELKRHLRGKSCPSICSHVLAGLCHSFGGDMFPSTRCNPLFLGLWDVGYEWITMPRSPNDFTVLLKYMSTCQCSLRQRAHVWHVTGEQRLYMYKRLDPEAQQSGMLSIFLLFSHFLDPFVQLAGNVFVDTRLTDGEASLRRLGHYHPKWPSNISSLLPHGAERTILGLVAWLEHVPNLQLRKFVHDAIYVTLTFCHPLVLDTFLGSDAVPYQGVVAFTQKYRPFLQMDPDATYEEQESLFVDVFNALKSLCHIIHRFTVELATAAQKRTFNGHAPRALLESYAHILAMADECKVFRDVYLSGPDGERRMSLSQMNYQRVEQIQSQITDAGAHLLIAHPEIADGPDAPQNLLRFRQARDTLQNGTQIDTQTIIYLEYLAISQRCMAAGCSITSKEVSLQSCKGCLRFRYCSRRCQKRDWTAKILHKAICKGLKHFCELNDVPFKDIRDEELLYDSARAFSERLIRHIDDWSLHDIALRHSTR